MAIPSNSTVASIVTEALKRAGRTSPTATQITDATAHQFREVKADISTVSGYHPSLLTQSMSAGLLGASMYAWPTDAQDIAEIQLIGYPEEGNYRSTCTAGSTTTVTLSAGLDIELRAIQGRYIFMTSGTSLGSFGQVVSWDNTTKVAVIDTAWRGAGTTPVSGDTYVLESVRYNAYWHSRFAANVDATPYTLGTPSYAHLLGRNAVFSPVFNLQYVVLWTYWAHLDFIDEAGAVFLRHLRENRSLWLQGIAVKCDQRYDEDRYTTEFKVYDAMLQAYGGTACRVMQGQYND